MYICKYFKLKELVSKAIYEKYNEKAWEFFDPKALMTLDDLRVKFGGLIVNDYPFGGTNQYRGYRESESKVGAPNSQHRHGRAFDVTSSAGKFISANEMREYILAHQHEFPYISAIEMDVSWLHFDCRNADTSGGIIKFHK